MEEPRMAEEDFLGIFWNLQAGISGEIATWQGRIKGEFIRFWERRIESRALRRSL
ncbi:hypothetical protein Droror1_Dr00026754, partial [Drosera rotundifolia]